MDIGQIFTNITSIAANQDLIARIVLLIITIMYAGFAAVVAREVAVLNNIANQINFSPIFRLLSYFNLVCSLAVILTIIFIM